MAKIQGVRERRHQPFYDTTVMPKLIGVRERMNAGIYYNFDMSKPSMYMRGIIQAVNFPGYSPPVDPEDPDSPYGKTVWAPPFTTFVIQAVHIYPNLLTRDLHPEVINHVGQSKILVFSGGKVVLDYPPGVLAMAPYGRMKPERVVAIPTRQQMYVEWHIINNDMPAPMVHTVGLRGVMTRDVL